MVEVQICRTVVLARLPIGALVELGAVRMGQQDWTLRRVHRWAPGIRGTVERFAGNARDARTLTLDKVQCGSKHCQIELLHRWCDACGHGTREFKLIELLTDLTVEGGKNFYTILSCAVPDLFFHVSAPSHADRFRGGGANAEVLLCQIVEHSATGLPFSGSSTLCSHPMHGGVTHLGWKLMERETGHDTSGSSEGVLKSLIERNIELAEVVA